MRSGDMVHEALGHGITALLTGDRILSLSTVALQDASASPLVSASGTAANCIAGALSLLLVSRVKTLSASAYFLWLFGAFNLSNSGYLVASSITGSGDWANVIAWLLLVPQIVAQHARKRRALTRSMPFSKWWLIVAIAATTVFIAVLGPGIRF